MNIQDLGSIGELVAAIATVGTLIYLAIQIRHNSRTNQISAELECLKLLTDWVSRVSENPEKQRLWDKSASQTEIMSEEESRQFLWMMGEFGWITQTAFIQYERGYLSHRAWSEFERMQVGYLQNELVRTWWDNRETPFSSEFVSYIDKVRGAGVNWRPVVTGRKGEVDGNDPGNA